MHCFTCIGLKLAFCIRVRLLASRDAFVVMVLVVLDKTSLYWAYDKPSFNGLYTKD